MCPTDIIKPDEIPDKWGLIYVNDKRKITVIKHPYKDNLRESKFKTINTENERYLLTRWLSKTEDPEKVMLMLRETNNKFNKLCKNYDNLKDENKKLHSVKNIVKNLEYEKKIDINKLNDELQRLNEIEFYLTMYKDTGDEKFLNIALNKVKDDGRKVRL